MTHHQSTFQEQQSPWSSKVSTTYAENRRNMDSNERRDIDLQSLIARLGNVSFFKNMPVAALKDIVYAGQIRNYAAKSTLFREGEAASGMHVLFRGQVILTKIGLQGIEYIVHIIKPVIMFNEITVIDGQANPVTAIAAEDVTTWQVSPEDYKILMDHYPEVGLGLLRILAERNRILLARYEDLMSRPVLARTAKLLYSLSEYGRQPINRYDHPNQRIAAMAGTVPEAVSRAIKILKENGVIDCTRKLITILSVDQLICAAQIDTSIMEYKRQP